MVQYKLTYFEGRGSAEIIRQVSGLLSNFLKLYFKTPRTCRLQCDSFLGHVLIYVTAQLKPIEGANANTLMWLF